MTLWPVNNSGNKLPKSQKKINNENVNSIEDIFSWELKNLKDEGKELKNSLENDPTIWAKNFMHKRIQSDEIQQELQDNISLTWSDIVFDWLLIHKFWNSTWSDMMVWLKSRSDLDNDLDTQQKDEIKQYFESEVWNIVSQLFENELLDFFSWNNTNSLQKLKITQWSDEYELWYSKIIIDQNTKETFSILDLINKWVMKSILKDDLKNYLSRYPLSNK